MNTKLVKRLLAATLAATLMVAPVLTAGATTQSSGGQASSGATYDGTGASSEAPSAFADTSVVSVGGVVLRSGVPGAYSIKGISGIQGFAVRQQASTVKANLGLAGTPYVRAYDITAAKSPAAFACINAMAASVGATVLGAINVDFGQMNGGKFSALPQNVAVPATIGVTNGGGRKLAVVCVLPGGLTSILEDQDDNAATVTFNMVGGLAAYAVIAY